jgi:hypothetical protein
MVSGMRAAMQASIEKKQADEASARAVEREAAALERMKQRYGDLASSVERSRRSAEAMGKSLRDGSLVRATRDMERFRREEARYRREAEMRSRYGDRVGGFFAKNEKPLHMLESAARTLMAKTDSLYNRGMQGTVEQGRREMELNLLGREVASIFKPLSDATTDATRGLRKWMQGLSKSEQNLLMGAGVGVAGILGAVAMRRGGGLGALALGSGAGLAGGMGLGEAASLGLTAKALYDMKKPTGMPPLAETPKPTPPTKTPGGRISGFLGSVAPFTGSMALPIVNAVSLYKGATGGYYDELRARGNNRLTSILGAGGGGLMDTISEPLKMFGLINKTYGEAFREKFPVAKRAHEEDEEAKRRVMMQGGGFQESGAGYEQLAVEFGKVAMPEEKKAGEGEMAKTLTEIAKMLATVVKKAEESAPPELRRPEGH